MLDPVRRDEHAITAGASPAVVSAVATIFATLAYPVSMEANAEGRLEEVIAEVDRLLEKHRLLETVARRQDTPRSALLEEMQHRQNLVELHKRLRTLHPADLGHILESLPIGDRLVV